MSKNEVKIELGDGGELLTADELAALGQSIGAAVSEAVSNSAAIVEARKLAATDNEPKPTPQAPVDPLEVAYGSDPTRCMQGLSTGEDELIGLFRSLPNHATRHSVMASYRELVRQAKVDAAE